MDLLQWIIERQQEITEKTNIVRGEEISYAELNKRMAEFGGDYAWVISQSIVAEEAYRRKKLAYDTWYNKYHIEIKNTMSEKATLKAIDAEMSLHYSREWKQWQEQLLELEMQRAARKQFVNVWSSLKDIYVELARNMRSDFRSSGGLSVTDQRTEEVETVKRIRRRMKNGS